MTTEITSTTRTTVPEHLWPFPTALLDSANFKIAVTDLGRGASLLFIHVGFSSLVWRHVLNRLRNDYRCICIDAPGTGGSIASSAGAITLESAARAITEVIDTLELSDITLVFHDLGGIAALTAAARRPQQIGALVAVNTFGWKPSRPLDIALRIAGSRVVTAVDVHARVIPRLTGSGFGMGKNAGVSTRRAIRDALDERALRSFHAYMRDARRCDALYDEIAAALRGPLGGLPLLTIFGERNDPFGFQKRWKQLFPSAQQVVVPKGNHFPMCDDPDLVAASIKTWLHEGVEN